MRFHALHHIFVFLIVSILPVGGVFAGITVEMHLKAPADLEVFFKDDLQFKGKAPSSVVFTTTVQSDVDELMVYFVLSMHDNGGKMFSGRSPDFPLKSGILHLNNLDLTEKSSAYHIGHYEIESQAEMIKRELFNNGYLPADRYCLILEIFEAAVQELPIASDSLYIHVTNPFAIRLTSPAGTIQKPAVVDVTTPVFTWTSKANRFLLKIYEKPIEEVAPEFAVKRKPHYETELTAEQTDGSFMYPGSGVPRLETHQIYYWQVTSLVNTSNGLCRFKSKIGVFTIVPPADIAVKRILTTLHSILGDKYENYFEQLSSYQPTGRIRLDGESISVSELESIARAFKEGIYQMTAVGTE